jgi:hypothetical protein
MSQRLEKGKIITVYEDPLTEKRPEGMARLIEQIGVKTHHNGLEYWAVEFISDEFLAQRFILPE